MSGRTEGGNCANGRNQPHPVPVIPEAAIHWKTCRGTARSAGTRSARSLKSSTQKIRETPTCHAKPENRRRRPRPMRNFSRSLVALRGSATRYWMRRASSHLFPLARPNGRVRKCRWCFGISPDRPTGRSIVQTSGAGARACVRQGRMRRWMRTVFRTGTIAMSRGSMLPGWVSFCAGCTMRSGTSISWRWRVVKRRNAPCRNGSEPLRRPGKNLHGHPSDGDVPAGFSPVEALGYVRSCPQASSRATLSSPA